MAGRVVSELARHRARLTLVIDDRREPTSHGLTSPDALAQLTRLLTNLAGDVHAVPATVAISRCACISCAWQARRQHPPPHPGSPDRGSEVLPYFRAGLRPS